MKQVIKHLTANNIKEVIASEKFDYVARIVKSALYLLDFIKSDMEVLDKLHRFGGDVASSEAYRQYGLTVGDKLLDPQFVSDTRVAVLNTLYDLLAVQDALEGEQPSVSNADSNSTIALTYDSDTKGIYFDFIAVNDLMAGKRIAIKSLNPTIQNLVKEEIKSIGEA